MRHMVRNRGFEPRGEGGARPSPDTQSRRPEWSRAKISHRSSPQNGEGEQESMKTCYKEGTVLEAAWQAATG